MNWVPNYQFNHNHSKWHVPFILHCKNLYKQTIDYQSYDQQEPDKSRLNKIKQVFTCIKPVSLSKSY